MDPVAAAAGFQRQGFPAQRETGAVRVHHHVGTLAHEHGLARSSRGTAWFASNGVASCKPDSVGDPPNRILAQIETRGPDARCTSSARTTVPAGRRVGRHNELLDMSSTCPASGTEMGFSVGPLMVSSAENRRCTRIDLETADIRPRMCHRSAQVAARSRPARMSQSGGVPPSISASAEASARRPRVQRPAGPIQHRAVGPDVGRQSTPNWRAMAQAAPPPRRCARPAPGPGPARGRRPGRHRRTDLTADHLRVQRGSVRSVAGARRKPAAGQAAERRREIRLRIGLTAGWSGWTACRRWR